MSGAKGKATVYVIWTSLADGRRGLMCEHTRELSIDEACALAFRLNKEAREKRATYRYLAQPS